MRRLAGGSFFSRLISAPQDVNGNPLVQVWATVSLCARPAYNRRSVTSWHHFHRRMLLSAESSFLSDDNSRPDIEPEVAVR